jgi:hypothetical protein
MLHGVIKHTLTKCSISTFLMKKIIGFSSLVIVLIIMVSSCGNEEAKKEVIVVPVQTQPVIVKEKEPVKKSTTITLDKNGVKVEAKKVDVTIKN